MKPSFVKAGLLVLVICVILAIILFGVIHFTNKQNDTNEENSDTIADDFEAVCQQSTYIIVIFVKASICERTVILSFSPLFSIQNAEEFYLPNGQPIIRLPKYGQLKGSLGLTAWTNQTIFQFRNVPYAESPSGTKRFKVCFRFLETFLKHFQLNKTEIWAEFWAWY